MKNEENILCNKGTKYEIDEKGLEAFKKLYNMLKEKDTVSEFLSSKFEEGYDKIDKYIELTTPIIKGEKSIPLTIMSMNQFTDDYDIFKLEADIIKEGRKKYNLYKLGKFDIEENENHTIYHGFDLVLNKNDVEDYFYDIYSDKENYYYSLYSDMEDYPESVRKEYANKALKDDCNCDIYLGIDELYKIYLCGVEQISKLDEETKSKILEKLEIDLDKKISKTINVYRIMSFDEFTKYINGEELLAYKKPGISTDATEPTFYFADDMRNLYELTCNVDPESIILCEFLASEDIFEKGYGDVIHYYHFGCKEETIELPELHLNKYNNQTLKLLGCAYLGEEREISQEIKDTIEKYELSSLKNEYRCAANIVFAESDRESDYVQAYMEEHNMYWMSIEERKEYFNNLSDYEWENFKWAYDRGDYYDDEYEEDYIEEYDDEYQEDYDEDYDEKEKMVQENLEKQKEIAEQEEAIEELNNKKKEVK